MALLRRHLSYSVFKVLSTALQDSPIFDAHFLDYNNFERFKIIWHRAQGTLTPFFAFLDANFETLMLD